MLPPTPIECPTISNLHTRLVSVSLGKASNPPQGDDTLDWPPSNLIEYMGWLNARLMEIPAEYRDSADVDVQAQPFGSIDDLEEDCDPEVTLSITYLRPPTPEEVAERIELHEAMAEVRMIRYAASRAAEAGVLGTPEAAQFLLSPEDFAALERELNSPAQPNDSLKALMRKKDD